MNLTQVQTILKIAWRLGLSGKIPNLPIFTLVGDTGIGKSTIMNTFYDELAAPKNEKGDDRPESERATVYETKYLAQIEVGDLIGMPDRSGDQTIWLKPAWWPKPNSKGILFFDELSDAKTDVRAAVMPMLLTRKMHQNILPDEVLIVCAMNPVGGEFGGYTFTRQFKDRLAFLKVTPTVEEWIAFAEKAKLPLYSKNMISEQPDFFLDTKKGNKDDGDWTTNDYYNGTPSRRSVTTAIQVYEALTEEEKASVGDILLQAICGDTAAAGIVTYSKRNISELINPRDIYDADKSLILLGTISAWAQNDNAERLGSFVRQTKAMLKADNGVQKKNIKALAALLNALPEDLSIALLSYIKTEVKSGQVTLLSLSSDPAVFARIDKLMNPQKYRTKTQAPQEANAANIASGAAA